MTGKRDNLKSVNFHTPKEKCLVKYRDLDFAVDTYLDLMTEMLREKHKTCGEKRKHGLTETTNDHQTCLKCKWRSNFDSNHRNIGVIFAGKTDLKSAFRILGLSQESWRWMIMHAHYPLTGIWQFFIDKCLLFGASISCSQFQRFSNALCHLIEFRINEKKRTTNYLDDFLFIAQTLARYNFMIRKFLKLCEELGVLVSPEKTEWGSELIVFLGILLDGRSKILAIPEEKRSRAKALLQELIGKKKTMVGHLQKLCGFLNFLGKAIVPG